MSDTDRDNEWIGHAYQEKPQRKFTRGIPDELQVARDVPKPLRQATCNLSIIQGRAGYFSVTYYTDKLSTTVRFTSLNELLTFVGDWASGQYNEVKE